MKYFYFVNKEGVRQGPMPLDELVAQGITPDTLVWCKGMANWQKAKTVDEVMDLLKSNEPEPEPVVVAEPEPEPKPVREEPKSEPLVEPEPEPKPVREEPKPAPVREEPKPESAPKPLSSSAAEEEDEDEVPHPWLWFLLAIVLGGAAGGALYMLLN